MTHATPTPHHPAHRSRTARTAARYLALTAAAALFAAPLLFMLAASLKPDSRVLTDGDSWRALWPTEASLDNYTDVFTRVDFTRFLANSLLITFAVVAAGLVINSLAGYALARLPWTGRKAALIGVLAVMILPFEAIAVPLFTLMTDWGWRDSYQVQIVPFIANALSVYLFYTFFLDLPNELEEAARIDGAGPWRTFLQIIVPISKPVFATVAILSFLTQWGSFLWPVMVTSGEEYRPLPLAISTFQTLPPLQWGDIMAFGVMMVTPVLVVFLIFQRWFISSVAHSGLKG
ncbi:carbohydrate ABC transporter permease [Streptomyces rubiginosohelvolus]|uniref:carbohydrate ABC transporter permease n=1 Tax=Streptomyces rubiginosohelvolus TaxID=67362 RepID=UPI0036B612DA